MDGLQELIDRMTNLNLRDDLDDDDDYITLSVTDEDERFLFGDDGNIDEFIVKDKKVTDKSDGLKMKDREPTDNRLILTTLNRRKCRQQSNGPFQDQQNFYYFPKVGCTWNLYRSPEDTRLEGTNLTEYVKNIRQRSKTNVQPYLMVVSGQSCKSSFIEGDGWIINVNEEGNQVASFDLLFKFYYVMNLEWPESLRNFYNFLESYVYDLDVKPYNIVSSVHTNIFNFNTDVCSESE
ncbi:Protein of unknown function [Cotesia congregata]|uniref:Uncharacterized protein n=1 Tax=Cotesia congregata TaxID=51543 RepID=A0A8J2EBZ3_COTCN|nr:Protein of unknown function [Cotesia congregata]